MSVTFLLDSLARQVRKTKTKSINGSNTNQNVKLYDSCLESSGGHIRGTRKHGRNQVAASQLRTGIPSPRSVQVQDIPTGTTAKGAISCFVAFVTAMTVHVLHGEPDPTVNVKHLTLGVGSNFTGRLDWMAPKLTPLLVYSQNKNKYTMMVSKSA